MITEATREARRKGLGGSDIAGIIPDKNSPTGTISPWMTQVQIWNSKVNPLAEEDKNTESLWWGSNEEDLVAKRFSELTGKRTVNHNKMIVDGCLLANLDRLIIPDGQKVAAHMGQIRTTELFEAKTSGCAWNKADPVEELANGYQILDGENGIPAHYLTQVTHYLGRVPTAEKIYVAVKAAVPTKGAFGEWFARTEFHVYVLKRDDEMIAAQDAFAREWWDRHVVGGVKPDPVCEADCKIIWRRSAPKTAITLDTRVWEAWNQLKAAKAMADDAERAENAAKAVLKRAMGDREAILGPDGKTEFATWKSAKDKVVFTTDWERIARGLNPSEAEIAAVATTWESIARSKGATEEMIAANTTKTVKPGNRTFLGKFTDKVVSYAATVDESSLPLPPPEDIPEVAATGATGPETQAA